MLIDTHCHLTSSGLVERLDEVLHNARHAGVGRMIVIAEDAADARVGLDLLAEHPDLYLVAGLHPHRAERGTPEEIDALVGLLTGRDVSADLQGRIVGVGETGLDLHYEFAPAKRQERVFRLHLEWAVEAGLPVVIHARKAEARVCEILADFPQLAGRVVFHCFSAGPAVAQRVLDLGGYLSFTGVVTFKNSRTIRAAAQMVPRDRIMIETDAPYLTPEPVRKMRPNEPALVVHTARFLAELRKEDLDTFVAATTANATRLFNLPEEQS